MRRSTVLSFPLQLVFPVFESDLYKGDELYRKLSNLSYKLFLVQLKTKMLISCKNKISCFCPLYFLYTDSTVVVHSTHNLNFEGSSALIGSRRISQNINFLQYLMKNFTQHFTMRLILFNKLNIIFLKSLN
jgi:hypothetical protein